MKLTNRLLATLTFSIILAAPISGRAESTFAEELLDATHDMRAQADLKQEIIPNWEAPVSDSFSVTNGGSPFTQGASAGFTIDDNAPGLDVGSIHTRVGSLEDLSDE